MLLRTIKEISAALQCCCAVVHFASASAPTSRVLCHWKDNAALFRTTSVRAFEKTSSADVMCCGHVILVLWVCMFRTCRSIVCKLHTDTGMIIHGSYLELEKPAVYSSTDIGVDVVHTKPIPDTQS